MTKQERIEIAQRWTAALSTDAAKPLKDLADVLHPEVCTTSLTGKKAVIEQFKSLSVRPLFKTGTWLEPKVEANNVFLPIRFHEKAAYHSGVVTITVEDSGLITRATTTINVAPDPLGHVINRVWGARSGKDRLPDHVSRTYGVKVKAMKQLDHGVFRIDHDKSQPWIVRLFPSDRPLADVEGDAAILRFLEAEGFPAERCVADVSVHEDQGVLVTGFIKGSKPQANATTLGRLGDLVGRLHSMKGGPKAVKRSAGALHLFTADCTVKSEIETAKASLEAASFRGTNKAWEALREGLDEASDMSQLPKALMHPDPATVNVISARPDLTLIDWAGAGHGPRILGLGLLLSACVSGKTFNAEWADAMMRGYTQHVRLQTKELDHLEQAVAQRLLIHEAYSWAVGMATQRKPASRKNWPHNNEGIARMADHIRRVWA